MRDWKNATIVNRRLIGDFKCLSNMRNSEIIVIDLLVYDQPNEYEIEELSDCTNESKVDTTDCINENNGLDKVLISDIKTDDTRDSDVNNDNHKLEEIVDLRIDKIEDPDNDDLKIENDSNEVADNQYNNGVDSTIIKSNLDKDTEHAHQYESEKIVDAPSSSKGAHKKNVEKWIMNTWAIEKTIGLQYIQIVPLQNKSVTYATIQSGPSNVRALINNERQMVKLRQRFNQPAAVFKCDHCDKVFATRKQKWNHKRYHVRCEKKYMCDQCSFRCHTTAALKIHMLYHLEPIYRPHQCEVCDKRFAEKPKLMAHTRIHTGERPFKCDICDKTFTNKESLTMHVQTKHNKEPKLDKVKAKLSVNYFRLLRTPAYIRIHNKGKKLSSLKEGIDYEVARDSELTTYKCNVCKETFSHLGGFYEHYKNAQRTVPCPECDRTFKFPSTLAEHVNLAHNRDKQYLCNICGARFVTELRLQIHLSSHSNEKPFKCDECPATFKYKCGVYTHKMIHKCEKPYECAICKARFRYKGTIIGHMKVHTKERPFKCNICHKKFSWNRNLKNHLKKHSKEQK